MPMPQEYQRAETAFEKLLVEIIDALDLTTRNQAYTSLQAVLVVFRRRLNAQQILSFATALPAITRAIFVQGWTAAETCKDFGSLDDLEAEVRHFRQHHNFSPAVTIPHVTRLVRQFSDTGAFDKALQELPVEAQIYWGAEHSDAPIG